MTEKQIHEYTEQYAQRIEHLRNMMSDTFKKMDEQQRFAILIRAAIKDALHHYQEKSMTAEDAFKP